MQAATFAGRNVWKVCALKEILKQCVVGLIVSVKCGKPPHSVPESNNFYH